MAVLERWFQDCQLVQCKTERNQRQATYTAVSTICTTTLFGSLVDLDVLDDQVAGV